MTERELFAEHERAENEVTSDIAALSRRDASIADFEMLFKRYLLRFSEIAKNYRAILITKRTPEADELPRSRLGL
jgi:hypothetical protein